MLNPIGGEKNFYATLGERSHPTNPTTGLAGPGGGRGLHSTKFYGLSAPLIAWGVGWLQKPLQLAGVFAALGIGMLRKETTALEALALGGVGYLIFMLLVGTTFQYLWAEPIILLLFLMNSGPLCRASFQGSRASTSL